MTDQGKADERPSGSIGFWGCWALTAGTMIGSGIFMLPAVLAPYGMLAFGGWAVTALGSIAIALTIGRLAATTSATGGLYVYARDQFGPLTGFMVAWAYWVGCWTSTPTVAIAFVGYFVVLTPALAGQPVAQALIALTLIWALTLVSLRGAKDASLTQIALTVLKILPMLAVAGLAVFVLVGGKAQPLPPPNPSGGAPLNVLATTALLTMWAFIGIECGAIPAGSVRDATRTIPRAVVAATLSVAVIYVAATAAVMFLVPVDALKTSTSPFSDAARGLGAWGPVVVSLGAMVATAGSVNGNIFVTGQTTMAMARDGVAPPAFGWLNKGEAPWVSLLVQGVLASLVLALNYFRGLVGAFTFLLTVSTLATLIPYLVCAAAELKRSWKNAKAWASVALIAAAYSTFAILGSGLEAMFWGLALTVVGAPLYFLMKRRGQALAEARAAR